jgi:hypothetical protein
MTVLKYLKEVLELEQYEMDFLRNEMNGMKFITLDESGVTALTLAHKFHAFKILSHSAELRNEVLKGAWAHHPLHFADWQVIHVGGYVHCKLEKPDIARRILRARLAGLNIVEEDSDAELLTALGGENGASSEVLECLKLLRDTERVRLSDRDPGQSDEGRQIDRDGDSVKEEEEESKIQKPTEENSGDDSQNHKQVNENSSSHKSTKKKTRMKKRKNSRTDSAASTSQDIHRESEKLGPVLDIAAQTPSEPTDREIQLAAELLAEKNAKDDFEKQRETLHKQMDEMRTQVLSQSRAMEDMRQQTLELQQARQQQQQEQQHLLLQSTGIVAALQHDNSELMRSFKSVVQTYEKDLSPEMNRLQSYQATLSSATNQERVPTYTETEPTQPPLAAAMTGESRETELSATASTLSGTLAPHVPPPMLSATAPSISEMATQSTAATATTAATNNRAVVSVNPSLLPDGSSSRLATPPSNVSALNEVRRSLELGENSQKLDIVDVIEEELQEEISIWRLLLERYRYDERRRVNLENTSAVLSTIASLWVRMGLQMFDDAALEPGPDTFPEGSEEDVIREALGGLLLTAKLYIKGVRDEEAQKEKEEIRWQSGFSSSWTNKSKSSLGASSSSLSWARQKRESKHEIAVVLLFLLTLVKKLMKEQQAELDRAQLLFYFKQLRTGKLPVGEVSRADLRTLFLKTLGVEFGGWDIFDALLQRIDTQRKGFVSPANLISAFQGLGPFHASNLPKHGNELAPLVICSIACDHLASTGVEFRDAFTDIISENQRYIPSMRELIDEDGYNGTAATSTSADVRLAKENALVADLFFETTRRFFEKERHATNPLHLRNTDPQNSVDDEQDMAHVSHQKGRQSEIMTYLSDYLEGCCLRVSRSLQIYEQGENAIIASLVTFLQTFYCFRRACMRHLLGELKSTTEDNLMAATQLAHGMLPQHVVNVIANLEADGKTLFGEAVFNNFEAIADRYSLAQLEDKIADMLGIPIPDGALFRTQILAEAKIHKTSRLAGDSAEYITAMRTIRDSLNASGLIKASPKNKTVIDSVNETIHVQRLQYIVEYQDYLNGRADRRRRILNGLMQLYEGAKIACAEHFDRQDKLNKFSGSFLMTKSDITRRTREIQRSILEEMQRQPRVHVEQLQHKIASLRLQVQDKSLEDNDGAIQVALAEVESLEKALLDSNKSALYLSAKIIRLIEK